MSTTRSKLLQEPAETVNRKTLRRAMGRLFPLHRRRRLRRRDRVSHCTIGSKVTADAELLAYRELDEAFALTEMVQDTLEDSRSSTAPARLALAPPERLWMRAA